MGFVKFLEVLIAAAGFIVPLAMLLESEGLPGPEKRAAVLAKLKKQLDEVGLHFPHWAERFIDPILGLLIDAVVAYLNRTGFFSHGEQSPAS